MGSFVACYLIVWIAVMVYVAHLGASQRKLQRNVQQLQKQLDRQSEEKRPSVRAA